MATQHQAELREFIRRLGVDDVRLDSLSRRVAALDDGIKSLWTSNGRGGMCLTTINGTIYGCNRTRPGASPLPDSQVRIVGHATGNSYGTFVAPAGIFSVGLVLSPADTSLDFYVTGPGVRFAESAARTFAVLQCGVTTISTLQAAPAAGYHCCLEFPFPLADTIEFEDSILGNRTATWAANSGGNFISPGAPLWWTPITNTTTPAGGFCGSKVTPMAYGFLAVGDPIRPLWIYRAFSNAIPTCPNLTGPTGTAAGISVPTKTGTAPGVSTKMDFTWGFSATSGEGDWLHGGSAGTFRAYEP